MRSLKFVHWKELEGTGRNWKEDDAHLGYLADYPDYWTQGESLDDLKAHLIDLFHDLTSGELLDRTKAW